MRPFHLSLRGWAFLALSSLLLVLGSLLALLPLVQAGLFLLSLLGLALLLGLAPGVRVSRRAPARATASSPLRVVLEVSGGRGPWSSCASLEESLPATRGGVLSLPLASGGYTLSPPRGPLVLGPTSLVLSDPFGLVSRRSVLVPAQEVLVRPRPSSLPTFSSLSSSSDALAPLEGTLREYRQGDDTRRIHWRVSARRGDLVVREDDVGVRPPLRVVLDVRPVAGDLFEAVVSATAAVVLALSGSGRPFELFDSSGRDLLPSSSPDALPDAALDALARVVPVSSSSLVLPPGCVLVSSGVDLALPSVPGLAVLLSPVPLPSSWTSVLVSSSPVPVGVS